MRNPPLSAWQRPVPGCLVTSAVYFVTAAVFSAKEILAGGGVVPVSRYWCTHHHHRCSLLCSCFIMSPHWEVATSTMGGEAAYIVQLRFSPGHSSPEEPRHRKLPSKHNHNQDPHSFKVWVHRIYRVGLLTQTHAQSELQSWVKLCEYDIQGREGRYLSIVYCSEKFSRYDLILISRKV